MDRVAIIGRPIDGAGAQAAALLVTTLRSSAAQVLLNAETGDTETRRDRSCGCLLGELGLTRHVPHRRPVPSTRDADVPALITPLAA